MSIPLDGCHIFAAETALFGVNLNLMLYYNIFALFPGAIFLETRISEFIILHNVRTRANGSLVNFNNLRICDASSIWLTLPWTDIFPKYCYFFFNFAGTF